MASIHRLAPATAQRWTMAVVSLTGFAMLTACGSSSTSGTAGASASAATTAQAASATARAAAAARSASAERSSAAASSAAIRCGQLRALGGSLAKFTHAAVSLESAGQLAADLANVDHQLTKLKDQTTVAFSAQESQLTAAVDKIGKDARTFAEHPSDAHLDSLAAAVNNLKAAAKPVIRKIDATCPSK
jgi:hypothetical protein